MDKLSTIKERWFEKQMLMRGWPYHKRGCREGRSITLKFDKY